MEKKKYHGECDYDNYCYYQLYHSKNGLTVVCMQWFDESDYNQNKFVRNSENEIHCFADEEEAIKKLNEWFSPELIAPEFRRFIKN